MGAETASAFGHRSDQEVPGNSETSWVAMLYLILSWQMLKR
jgi:hypothetical protein